MTVIALAVAVVALAIAALALRRADVVERRARAWTAGGAAPGAAAATGGRGQQPQDAKRVEALERRLAQLEQAPAATALRHVAVVRYDAFEDLGGRMSFSAAVLDDQGKGLVLTAIHGRTETRSYLKQVPVAADSGQRELSPEERQAVSTAMRGAGR